MLFTQASILSGGFRIERADLRIRGGRIADLATFIEPEEGELVVRLPGKLIAPGLINLHTHGAAGYDTMDATGEAFEAMSRYHAAHATTAFLPTTTTMSQERIVRALSAANAAMDDGVSGARIAGINLEGPYLSAEKRGAHDPIYLRSVRQLDFGTLQRAARNNIRLVTLAPETDGALDFIRDYSAGVHISIGHTAASYEQCFAAYRAGATHTTHLFNAMSPLLHRAPGPIAAAHESGAYVELICDGLHVAPSVVKMAFEMFAGRVCVITDAMRAAGMPDGEYELGGTPVTVSGGIARQVDGTIAGGTCGLIDCVHNLIAWGVRPEAAIRAASLTPAQAIGIDEELGSIEPGKKADLVVFGANYSLCATYVGGKCVYCAPGEDPSVFPDSGK